MERRLILIILSSFILSMSAEPSSEFTRAKKNNSKVTAEDWCDKAGEFTQKIGTLLQEIGSCYIMIPSLIQGVAENDKNAPLKKASPQQRHLLQEKQNKVNDIIGLLVHELHDYNALLKTVC